MSLDNSQLQLNIHYIPTQKDQNNTFVTYKLLF